MFRTIVNAVIAFVAAVARVLGLPEPGPWGWRWTEDNEPGLAAPPAIRDRVQAYMRAQRIRAGQLAIRVDGQLVVSAAYTWAEDGYPMTRPGSLMRIASCSKTFTTAAIHALVRRGSVQPGDRVFNLIGIDDGSRQPADARVRDITVEQLIGHRGGWDYRNRPVPDPVFDLKRIGRALGLHRPVEKPDFAAWLFERLPLDFVPGNDSVYSNVGYTLLGMVVQARAGGLTFEKFVNGELLAPRGIAEVFVGATALSGAHEREVRYDDPSFGPDATRDPFDPMPAPLPYGGAGARLEVMDAGGGLITNAATLSHVASQFDSALQSSMGTDGRRRPGTQRNGDMPGSSACMRSFDAKLGSRRYDYAFIFNRWDWPLKQMSRGRDLFDALRGDLDRLIEEQL